jgi:hypothetical protein
MRGHGVARIRRRRGYDERQMMAAESPNERVTAEPASRARLPLARLAGVAVFAIAMAYVEAAIVVYLRKLFAVQYDLVLTAKSFHFPAAYLHYEQGREAATIVMLVAIAALTGRSLRHKAAYFLFAFGVWDIFYYVWLYALLRWPSSPGQRDLLFLIPGEWWAPVWQPLAIAAGFVVVAIALLAWRGKRRTE